MVWNLPWSWGSPAGYARLPCSPDTDHDPGDSFHVFGDNSAQNNNTGSGSQTNINHFYMPNSAKCLKDRLNDFMKALKVVNYRDGKDRYPSKTNGTCQWVTCDARFLNWDRSRLSGLLCITADPGCGKSVLAKHLVEQKLADKHGGGERIICYFFSMDGPTTMDREACALRCILHQVFDQRPELIDPGLPDRLQQEGDLFLRSINELWKILVDIARDNEVVCVLDALDEFPNMGLSLCHKLRELEDLPERVSLKFLATYRPYSDIQQALGPTTHPPMRLSEEAAAMRNLEQDVDVYINERLGNLASHGKIKEDGMRVLQVELKKNKNRTYLWVYLVLGWIETMQRLDPNNLRSLMCKLPRNVEDAYQEILGRSDERPGERHSATRDILKIVVAAQRTLTLGEMWDLRNIDNNPSSIDGLDFSNEDFSRELRDEAALFISVVGDRIYLLHQTAKDFLVQRNPEIISHPNDRTQETFQWRRSLHMDDCHGFLAGLCMKYQALGDFSAKRSEAKGSSQAYAQRHSLFDYAATYWASHYRESSAAAQMSLKERAQDLCSKTGGKSATWFYVYWEAWESRDPPCSMHTSGFTPMMAMCYLGFDVLVQHHLKNAKYSLPKRDAHYKRTALTWASRGGFDKVVQLLLEERVSRWFGGGVRLNSRDRHSWTALSHAVYQGHLGVMEHLLQAGARQDLIDLTGLTFTQLARKNESVIGLLKAYDTERPKWRDWLDFTSLLPRCAVVCVGVLILPIAIPAILIYSLYTLFEAIARERRLKIVDNHFPGYGTFSRQQHMV